MVGRFCVEFRVTVGGNLPCALLYDIAGQVKEVRRHVNEVVQYAVFLLVIGHVPLTLLTLGPRIATLAQALVGLHAHSSVAAGWLTFGCSKEGKTNPNKLWYTCKARLLALGTTNACSKYQGSSGLGYRWTGEGTHRFCRRAPPSLGCSSTCQ